MPKCTFCGESIEKGTGKIFVYTSGKIANFCSMKCEKSLLKLKRKPLNIPWTAAYRKEHKKEDKTKDKEIKTDFLEKKNPEKAEKEES